MNYVNKRIQDINFPDKEIQCYNDSKGIESQWKYNFHKDVRGKDLGDRVIIDQKNGYIQVSGFGASWFKISEFEQNQEYLIFN